MDDHGRTRHIFEWDREWSRRRPRCDGQWLVLRSVRAVLVAVIEWRNRTSRPVVVELHRGSSRAGLLGSASRRITVEESLLKNRF